MVEGYVPIPEELVSSDAGEEAIEQDLRSMLVSGGELNGVQWELVSVTGEAASEIIRICQDQDAACVVVGKRHRGFAEFLHRMASGSVSRAVMAAQKFPVLVVP